MPERVTPAEGGAHEHTFAIEVDMPEEAGAELQLRRSTAAIRRIDDEIASLGDERNREEKHILEAQEKLNELIDDAENAMAGLNRTANEPQKMTGH